MDSIKPDIFEYIVYGANGLVVLTNGYIITLARQIRDAFPEQLQSSLEFSYQPLSFATLSSVLTFLIVIISFMSVYQRSSILLFTTMILYTYISIIEISSGLNLIRMSTLIESQVTFTLANSIEYYANPIKSKLIDTLQTTYSCCGIFAPEIDWFDYASQNNFSFPISCCNSTSSTLPCTIVTKPPCASEISSSLQKSIAHLGTVSIIEPFGQMVIVFFSLILAQVYSIKHS